MADEQRPGGMLFIITSPDGRVGAAEADFTETHPPAYRREEAQEERARTRAWRDLLSQHASGPLYKAITMNGGEFLVDRLRQNFKKLGWREEVRSIDRGMG